MLGRSWFFFSIFFFLVGSAFLGLDFYFDLLSHYVDMYAVMYSSSCRNALVSLWQVIEMLPRIWDTDEWCYFGLWSPPWQGSWDGFPLYFHVLRKVLVLCCLIVVTWSGLTFFPVVFCAAFSLDFKDRLNQTIVVKEKMTWHDYQECIMLMGAITKLQP